MDSYTLGGGCSTTLKTINLIRMKLTRHILLLLAISAGLLSLTTACKGPKEIPDDDLANIFHDAFLANAYLDEHHLGEDSLKVYEPIFERYGYTYEDVEYTIKTLSERKSARLSDLVDKASRRLDEEQRAMAYKIMVLDTIERIAQRSFTRTMYSDSLIHVTKLKDTDQLYIDIPDLVPGKYSVSFDYLIDSLDENRNSRIEVFLMRKDSSHVLRHTTMMSRYRAGKYSREINVDTTHKSLHINAFYRPRSEKAERPDIKITNLRVVRVLPAEVAVDSLYLKQLNINIFNHRMMTSFTADTLRLDEVTHIIESDNEPQDSITLRTDR